MSVVNNVIIRGKLGRKFDRRVLDNGDEVQGAVLEHYAFGKPTPDRFDLDCYGTFTVKQLADVGEGDDVIVVGRLRRRAWKDAQDQWQEKFQISVDRFDLVARAPRGNGMEPDTSGLRPVEADDDIPF